MNKKLLCAALLSGLGVAQVAFAQDTTTSTTTTTTTDTAPAADTSTGTFDDRWYVTGDIGYNKQDNSRDSENAMFGAVGMGRFISRNWSLDGQLNWQMPKANSNRNLNWAQYGVSRRPAPPFHRRRPQLEPLPPHGHGLPALGRGIRQLPEP